MAEDLIGLCHTLTYIFQLQACKITFRNPQLTSSQCDRAHPANANPRLRIDIIEARGAPNGPTQSRAMHARHGGACQVLYFRDCRLQAVRHRHSKGRQSTRIRVVRATIFPGGSTATPYGPLFGGNVEPNGRRSASISYLGELARGLFNFDGGRCCGCLAAVDERGGDSVSSMSLAGPLGLGKKLLAKWRTGGVYHERVLTVTV